jgi:hypothetical protein
MGFILHPQLAYCLPQIRVTAGLAPRSLSLALEAFPCVERLVLHDLNQLLLPVSCLE